MGRSSASSAGAARSSRSSPDLRGRRELAARRHRHQRPRGLGRRGGQSRSAIAGREREVAMRGRVLACRRPRSALRFGSLDVKVMFTPCSTLASIAYRVVMPLSFTTPCSSPTAALRGATSRAAARTRTGAASSASRHCRTRPGCSPGTTTARLARSSLGRLTEVTMTTKNAKDLVTEANREVDHLLAGEALARLS